MSNSTPSNGTASRSSFAGDEFSNNLLSDLAPLLTLFGEQVTKQFLSMSLGWADNILLAIGPLGIMTIIVSAIRVGGARRLKAIVGRARESRATAELELLTSTSADVCELWNGREIVRVFGVPNTKELFVFFKPDDPRMCSVSFLEEEIFEERFIEYDGRPLGQFLMKELCEGPPNLSLNLPTSTPSKTEMWIWVLVGIVAQCCAWALPAATTYYWKWTKGNSPVPAYGYPSYLVGSILILVGVLLCSHIIEGSTTETSFKAAPDNQIATRVVRLQRALKVGDRQYDSYILGSASKLRAFQTSRLNAKDYSKVAAAVTLITFLGFILQFVGLRALHWSATLTSLTVTLFMSGVRLWVRRAIVSRSQCIKLPPGHDLAYTVLFVDHQKSLAMAMGRSPDEWTDDDFSNHISCLSADDPFPPVNSFFPHFEIATGGFPYSEFGASVIRDDSIVCPISQVTSTTKLVDLDRANAVITSLNDLRAFMPMDTKLKNLADELLGAIIRILSATTTSSGVKWKQNAFPHRRFCWKNSFTHVLTRATDVGKSWGRAMEYGEFEVNVSHLPHAPRWHVPSIGKKYIQSILDLSCCSLIMRKDNTSDHHEPLLRIIGCANESNVAEEVLKISRWMKRELIYIPRPDGKRLFRTFDFRRPQFQLFPIFGFRFSTLEDANLQQIRANQRGICSVCWKLLRDQSHVFNPYGQARCLYTRFCIEELVKLEENCSMSHEVGLERNAANTEPICVFPQIHDEEKPKNSVDFTEVAVTSSNTWAVECALEIFSNFFLELTKHMSHIGGKVSSKPREEEGHHASFGSKIYYENSTVDDWCNLLVTSAPDLFPVKAETEAVLIPALVRNGLLVTENTDSEYSSWSSIATDSSCFI